MNTKTTRITPEQVAIQMDYCARIQAIWDARGGEGKSSYRME